jgi:Flp pilus assembly protein TadG
MMNRARRLATDTQAIAAIEFAFIAPIMITMICGFMEYAHVSSARSTLEAATMRAARVVAATDCPSEREAVMLATIRDAMKNVPSADGEEVEITTKTYSDKFGDVGEPEPFTDANGNGRWDVGEAYTDVNANNMHDEDMGTAGSIGGAGQVVSYNATYQVSSLFEFISYRFNGTDKYVIEASTVIRNEPVFRNTGCS